MAYTQSDLDAIRQAKLALARGDRVRSVTTSDGRRLENSEISADSLDRMEQQILRSLRTRRRRAYTVFSTKGT